MGSEMCIRDRSDIVFHSLTVVVTTSISVKPRQSTVTPCKVKRPVSLLPGELVCSAVRRRRRIRCIRNVNGVGWVVFQRFRCMGTCNFRLCSSAEIAEQWASLCTFTEFMCLIHACHYSRQPIPSMWQMLVVKVHIVDGRKKHRTSATARVIKDAPYTRLVGYKTYPDTGGYFD